MSNRSAANLKSRYRTLATLLITVSFVAALATAAQAQQAPPDDSVSLDGVVTINGDQAWAGIALVIESETGGEPCGAATTSESGGYSATLELPCQPDSDVVIVLQQLSERRASDPTSLGAKGETTTFNAIFALTDAELAELPPKPAESAVAEGAAGQALVQKTTSVFDEVEDLLRWLLISGGLLLGFMAVMMMAVTISRYKFMTSTFNKIMGEPDDDSAKREMKQWTIAVKADDKFQASRVQVFRWMVEGLVMSFVVIALIALGAAGKIEAQGIVSVLAAMVGYAAGRTVS